MNKDLTWKIENNTKMFNFDYITKEDIKKHNPKWPEIPDHPYQIIMIGDSGPEKTNSSLNLINHGQILIKFIHMLKTK